MNLTFDHVVFHFLSEINQFNFCITVTFFLNLFAHRRLLMT